MVGTVEVMMEAIMRGTDDEAPIAIGTAASWKLHLAILAAGSQYKCNRSIRPVPPEPAVIATKGGC